MTVAVADIYRRSRVGSVPRTLLVAIALFPLLLLAINSSWVYPPTGFIDPWIYSGYHTHIGRLLADSPSAYYGTRVPWTALGWAVHRLADTQASLIILALIAYYTSAYSLFYVIFALCRDATAGFIATCLLGTNSWFLFAIGWNYVDGPLIACIFASIAAVVAVTHGPFWRFSAAVWGATTAAMLAIYLMNAVVVPVELLIFAALYRLGNRRSLRVTVALGCAGFVAAAIAMGLINVSLGGDFNYVRATLAVLAALTPVATKGVYYAGLREWLPRAAWMLFPALTFLASVVFVVKRWRVTFNIFKRHDTSEGSPTEAAAFVLVAAYILVTSGCAFMQLIHWSMLSLFFRENTLLPFAFLAVGCFFALAPIPRSKRYDATMCISVALLCLAPWLLGDAGVLHMPLPYLKGVIPGHGTYVRTPLLLYGLGPEALVVAIGSFLLVMVSEVPVVAVYLLPVALMSFLSAATISIDTSLRIPADRAVIARSAVVFDAAKIVDFRFKQHSVFWWDTADAQHDIFLSLGSMYLQPAPATIAPGDSVIFLGTNGALSAAAKTMLLRDHLTVRATPQWAVSEGPVSFDIANDTVELNPAFFGDVSIPLAGIKPSTISGRAGLTVATPPQAWAYGATMRLPAELKQSHPGTAYVHVRMRVDRGSLGVGITSKDESAWIDRKFYHASTEARDVYLTVPQLAAAGSLVFCSDGANIAASALVTQVQVFYERSTIR